LTNNKCIKAELLVGLLKRVAITYKSGRVTDILSKVSMR